MAGSGSAGSVQQHTGRLRPRTGRIVVGLLGAVVLVAALLVPSIGPAAAATVNPTPVTADAETAPVSHSGDAADDPAIWRNAADPAQSLIIGNDKQGALDVFGLDGTLRQEITTTTKFWGNVDVRQGVDLGSGGPTVDLAAAYNAGLRLYDVSASGLTLATDGTGSINTGGGEGVCLYTSRTTGRTSAFVITIAGVIHQYLLSDADHDGLVDATLQRTIDVGSEAEGCVADDDTGALYVSEEDVALWRYGAEPGAGSTRTMVDSLQPDGHLVADVEGVTLVDLADGSGFVIVSAQNVASPSNSYFSVYSRTTDAFVGTFRVVTGATADGCSRTDGVTAIAQDLGPNFPSGVFICQDNNNTTPGTSGNQDFKLVRLERLLALWPTEPPTSSTTTSTTTSSTTTSSTTTTSTSVPPGSSAPTFVAARSTNGNRLTHSTPIPDAVTAGDTLVAFLGVNRSAAVTDPPGWTPVADVDDDSATGRAWTRTATSADAGTDVTVTTPWYSKSDLTVAAYRGSTSPIVVASRGSVQDHGSAQHVTPTVDSPSAGLVVSYWADKSSSAVTLQVDPPQIVRSASLGTGGGRIAAALSDASTTSGPGDVGGVNATGTTATSRTVMFTVVLATTGTPPPSDDPPVAVASASCNGAQCHFDGSGSSDDGTITSYQWTFGDGTTGSGAIADHTYTSSGTFTATLTVTDDRGATDADTVSVQPVVTQPPQGTTPSFVDGAATNGNRRMHSVVIPTSVQAGDVLVAFYGGNSSAAPSTPAGWTQVATAGDGSSQGRVWTKAAGPGDAGATLTVTTATYSKSDLTVLVYRGGAGVADAAGSVEVNAGSSHASPTLSAPAAGLVVNYWADKSSSAAALDVGDQTQRSSTLGTGGGRISAAASDSGAVVGPGTVGGAVATGTAASSRTLSFTVLLGAVTG